MDRETYIDTLERYKEAYNESDEFKMYFLQQALDLVFYAFPDTDYYSSNTWVYEAISENLKKKLKIQNRNIRYAQFIELLVEYKAPVTEAIKALVELEKINEKIPRDSYYKYRKLKNRGIIVPPALGLLSYERLTRDKRFNPCHSKVVQAKNKIEKELEERRIKIGKTDSLFDLLVGSIK